MGLDMYLTAERYICPHAYDKDAAVLRRAVANAIGFEETEDESTDGKITGVSIRVAYWRKANHIHNWFVENVQDGTDDCKKYGVSGGQLIELVDICHQILKKRNDSDGKAFAEEHLSTAEGFFFGGTEYDDYYYECLEDTIDMLSDLNKYKDCYFEYQSSW